MNFRHLYYFWVVAKEGSVTRAAARLGLAVQTVSTQLALLDQSVGKALLMPQGRRLVLTEAGRTALAYADQIFLLGEQMQDALASTEGGRMRLSVGVSDSVPKLTAYRILAAATRLDRPLRLACSEGPFDSLLGELALHKLDIVLTDRAVRSGTLLRVFSHLLFESEMIVAGTPALARRHAKGFPASLDGAPFLLPSRTNPLRGRVDAWFEQHGARPDVVGEFDDNALLNTFGRNGAGLFFAPAAVAGELESQLGAAVVGTVAAVREQFYLVSNERKVRHPAVEAILIAAEQGAFAAEAI